MQSLSSIWKVLVWFSQVRVQTNDVQLKPHATGMEIQKANKPQKVSCWKPRLFTGVRLQAICFLSKLTPSTKTYSLKVTMNNAVIQSVKTASIVALFTALFLTMFYLKRTLCGCKEKSCDWWLYMTLPACIVVVLLLCGPNLSEVLETDMLILLKKI